MEFLGIVRPWGFGLKIEEFQHGSRAVGETFYFFRMKISDDISDVRRYVAAEAKGLAGDIIATTWIDTGDWDTHVHADDGQHSRFPRVEKSDDPTGVEAFCRIIGRDKVAAEIEAWTLARIADRKKEAPVALHLT